MRLFKHNMAREMDFLRAAEDDVILWKNGQEKHFNKFSYVSIIAYIFV